MDTQQILNHFLEAQSVLEKFIANPQHILNIKLAGDQMVKSIKNGGKIISCGNGGSMSDAMHFAEEMTGRFRDNRAAMPAIAISDPTHLTCVGNDYGYDAVFSRFVEGMGQKGDVLLGISTSGNSKNVINAAKAAKDKGMFVVALTGKSGGELANIADIELRAPMSDFADRVQEIHIKIIHSLIHYIETEVIG
ncbi:D-sedoheptulose 7-phosphate isomerase [Putridiphycobacter roseus]|uniref:Phosphoheptose isomerase n=1 Tax=Putridiphycobacter roseus TaxID=2219161 RepID=A0A2W1NBW7_9FLAO|nr:D-sedoheptulose 7-phosphate isomerase [Putridiphycobacter roseus]PZE16825.1 D-sedoheptulose 7-phosphate isomerase [Putridiphycobacter roseus]